MLNNLVGLQKNTTDSLVDPPHKNQEQTQVFLNCRNIFRNNQNTTKVS